MALEKGASLYFLGIGGTGMASVAGLCAAAGYRVAGSDAGVYPPMSTMLEQLKIPIKTPYNPENLANIKADAVVVANVLSRGNLELEAAISSGTPITSFPQLLGDLFLKDRVSCVVTGTHGKTTTTSLLSYVLSELGEDPSFVIGGIPRNFPYSFHLGSSRLFVIEGDEYDTAFFDKGPKFLHYHAKHLILNNLEYDHADIYPNLAAIEAQFAKLLNTVANPQQIIANIDDPGIAQLVANCGMADRVTRVATLGKASNADLSLSSYSGSPDGAGGQVWTADFISKARGKIHIETRLSGKHNLANIAQVIATLLSLDNAGDLKAPLDLGRMATAVTGFQNVQRRLDLLASAGGVDLYEDFAHHPTAVRVVIEGFRTVYPKKRLLVAFEPRSASQRRNVFQEAFADALSLADRVYIGECTVDKRIPEDQRMNTEQLRLRIGSKATAFATNALLGQSLEEDLSPGDAVIFMSSGSFSGVQHRLAAKLRGQKEKL